jgi:HAD superfamily hydrolase (TIGR01549 family)
MLTIHGRLIRCILFDLGSTLWTVTDKVALQNIEFTSNQIAVEALRRCTDKIELSSMEAHTLGILLRRVVEKRIRFKTRKNPRFEPDFVLTTMEALQQLGITKANHTLGEEIYEALRIRIPQSRLLFEDSLPTLTVLKQHGYILGVVTNRHYGGQPFYEDLQTMGLLNYFEYDHMAISADLGIRKPNPDIFMYALNKLNVSPEEAAMVGDSLKADILGANMLDMLAIWKPKASVLEDAKVAWMTSQVASREFQAPTSSVQSRGTLPDGTHSIVFEDEGQAGFTDDYLLTYAHNRDGQKLHHSHDTIKPDITIENLKDLLTIF